MYNNIYTMRCMSSTQIVRASRNWPLYAQNDIPEILLFLLCALLKAMCSYSSALKGINSAENRATIATPIKAEQARAVTCII